METQASVDRQVHSSIKFVNGEIVVIPAPPVLDFGRSFDALDTYHCNP